MKRSQQNFACKNINKLDRLSFINTTNLTCITCIVQHFKELKRIDITEKVIGEPFGCICGLHCDVNPK